MMSGPTLLPDTGQGIGSSGSQKIRLDFAARPDAVRKAMILLRDLLKMQNIAICDVETTELVLAEVLNNIVEHACANLPDGRISVRIRNCTSALRCQVHDNGCRMPGGNPPDGRHPDPGGPVAELPEGGFGWMLIRGLTQDLLYRRKGDGNTLGFVIPLSPDCPACKNRLV